MKSIKDERFKANVLATQFSCIVEQISSIWKQYSKDDCYEFPESLNGTDETIRLQAANSAETLMVIIATNEIFLFNRTILQCDDRCKRNNTRNCECIEKWVRTECFMMNIKALSQLFSALLKNCQFSTISHSVIQNFFLTFWPNLIGQNSFDIKQNRDIRKRWRRKANANM